MATVIIPHLSVAQQHNCINIVPTCKRYMCMYVLLFSLSPEFEPRSGSKPPWSLPGRRNLHTMRHPTADPVGHSGSWLVAAAVICRLKPSEQEETNAGPPVGNGPRKFSVGHSLPLAHIAGKGTNRILSHGQSQTSNHTLSSGQFLGSLRLRTSRPSFAHLGIWKAIYPGDIFVDHRIRT